MQGKQIKTNQKQIDYFIPNKKKYSVHIAISKP